MHLQRLPAEEAAVRRYVEELWLPYHRDLEAAVDGHGLADGVDLVAEEVPFRLDSLAADDYVLWVAVDGADGDVDIAGGEGDLAGFVATDVDEAPSVFDRPDRLVVGDIYVHEQYRGTGLADDLVARAAERARNLGCPELALDVDVDNDRALAFYDSLGFEPRRYRMTARVESLSENS
ncbi:MAG: GNAT family N-acetyltransferase [Halobacterium sp.]